MAEGVAEEGAAEEGASAAAGAGAESAQPAAAIQSDSANGRARCCMPAQPNMGRARRTNVMLARREAGVARREPPLRLGVNRRCGSACAAAAARRRRILAQTQVTNVTAEPQVTNVTADGLVTN